MPSEEQDREMVAALVDKYLAEGLEPVRWAFKHRPKGCRACRDENGGPWTVTLMSTRLPEIGKALIFIVTLCEKCLRNKERCDDVSEEAASAYLRDRN